MILRKKGDVKRGTSLNSIPKNHSIYDVYPFDNSYFTSIAVIISGYGNTPESKGIVQKLKELINSQ